MSTHTIAPPPELTADERHGVYPCLVLPWSEELLAPNEHAGSSYEWGSVRLPRSPVTVTARHDGEPVGVASSFVQDRRGLRLIEQRVERVHRFAQPPRKRLCEPAMQDDGYHGVGLYPRDLLA